MDKQVKVLFVSLGCDKNLVDSEVMLGYIRDNNMIITDDDMEADIVVVNTCAFIHDAKLESIETIIELARLKETGNCKGLIVTGCLTQRYQEELMKEIPEIDGVLGTSNYDDIIVTIEKVLTNEKSAIFKDINYTPKPYINRMSNTTVPYAYLKIAEGCNNACSYCIIPKLRGRIRSREIESLVEETKLLVASGKQEIILVAQDLTKYGVNIYKKKALPKLLKELCKIDGLKWIRLLYCYPEDITDELIQVMAEEDKIVKYIDIPIQHINDDVLKNMYRKSNKETIINVVTKLRKSMPDIAIRSTVIVGFPGETEEQYIELKEFARDYKLDRLGAFTYSVEEGTKAAEMPNHVAEDVMIQRRDVLMALQQEISLENNEKMIGKTLEVLIEGYMPDEDVYVGRTYKDAPEVDGSIFVESSYRLETGQFVMVEVINANEYDLIGRLEDEFTE